MSEFSEKIQQARRIQTSLLNAAEKKALVKMAGAMPKWVTSDMLTFVGTLGALVIALGYYLSNTNIAFLWLASFGFVINWFGDSLDGSLARVRNTQRPLYGYYLDHTVDVINEAFMFLGAGLSPIIDMKVAVAAFIVYLALTLNVSMNAHLRSEFKLTYMGMGPTEFRIIVILLNTILFFCGESVYESPKLSLVTAVIPLILTIIYIVTIIKDLRYYASVDPVKKYDGKEEEKD